MKKCLFMVGSIYQLLNVIILRLTECKDSDCDLILRSSTIWNNDIIDAVKKENLFTEIYCPDYTQAEIDFWGLSLEEKKEKIANPLLFLGTPPPLAPIYDEMYAGVAHISWKLIYRQQLLSGKKPKVFMFDEGIRSYTIDLPKIDNEAYLDGEYAEEPFVNAIEALYLHQPDLYAIKDYNYELRKLENPNLNSHIKDTLIRIFGSEALPEESYIYLEDAFFIDRCITNDFELFEQLAEIVGKENIIVKCHPRDDFDRFSPLGYKTVGKSTVPWEIQLLSNNPSSKVFISVFSTSILTPYIIFDSDMHVISLERLFFGDNYTHSDVSFGKFLSNIQQMINRSEVHFHLPTSIDELKEVLQYIKLEQQLNMKLGE